MFIVDLQVYQGKKLFRPTHRHICISEEFLNGKTGYNQDKVKLDC
jgi:hypothetical protein